MAVSFALLRAKDKDQCSTFLFYVLPILHRVTLRRTIPQGGPKQVIKVRQ